jgi:hypothetical protein
MTKTILFLDTRQHGPFCRMFGYISEIKPLFSEPPALIAISEKPSRAD